MSNGWEHYELEKEMLNANPAKLLELFKRENEKYSEKCVEYVNKLNAAEEVKMNLAAECDHLDEARTKIALCIAEILTSVNG